MANFSAAVAFQVIGLCTSLKMTDTSDYVGNSEGYSISNIKSKTFTFRDGTGATLLTQTGDKNLNSLTLPTNLLTLNIVAELILVLDEPYNTIYSTSSSFVVPCLGV